VADSQSSSSKSSQRLLRRVEGATASGAEELNRKYRHKLEKLAERGMDPKLRRREDPEDVVQSVLRTVFRRAAQGELQFDHSGALWRLLETVTRHKILKHAEYHKAKRRTPRPTTKCWACCWRAGCRWSSPRFRAPKTMGTGTSPRPVFAAICCPGSEPVPIVLGALTISRRCSAPARRNWWPRPWPSSTT